MIYESVTARPDVRHGTLEGDCNIHVIDAGGYEWFARLPAALDGKAIDGRLTVVKNGSAPGLGVWGLADFAPNPEDEAFRIDPRIEGFGTRGATSDICGI